MMLGSHNSWSYLPVSRWWMRPIAFTARCQRVDIRTQYERCGVRCFDLRLRFDEARISGGSGLQEVMVVHGPVTYRITADELRATLEWLDGRGDVSVRVIHDVRRRSQHSQLCVMAFRMTCRWYVETFPHIRFWCGRNLCDWDNRDYDFGPDPTCDEQYASVCPPRLIDDWWPWLYARLHNRSIRRRATDKDILLIDFVDIPSDI